MLLKETVKVSFLDLVIVHFEGFIWIAFPRIADRGVACISLV